MTIRVLGADEWQTHRDLRLRALSADPGAFCSTWSRESGFDEATWRARTISYLDGPAAVFVSEPSPASAGPVGLTGMFGVGLPEGHARPGDVVAQCWGMWVAPEGRSRGVGEALVEAVIGWARDHGATALQLEVLADNSAARRLYERCGFAAASAAGETAGSTVMRRVLDT